MVLPDRDNPYSFDAYLSWRDEVDYYADDPFLQQVVRCYCGPHWQRIDEAARRLSSKASRRWRDLAEEAARLERRPYLEHYDAHNHRIDRIVRPLEVRTLEREVFAEALFSPKTPLWERLVKMYLIYQNGESCIACPLVCTEGLVAILEAFADTPETRAALDHCREGGPDGYGIGAQYLTEIQGGSDIPANMVEAVEEDGGWRLYGGKFFCSATHADYAVVTAKPSGSEQVAVFLVPSWLPGRKEAGERNGYTIDRLKWKMGTVELPTAEITFAGALAYPVGDLRRGLANVVGIVLTYSRLTVGLSGAASMTRAAREAARYSTFREAFGSRLEHFPLVAEQIAGLQRHARRTTAGAFRLYRDFIGLDGKVKCAIDPHEPRELQRRRFRVRELVMLQKITASWDAVDQLRMAMSIFGGHGVMEDFSALPRLLRDAAVNELWEGPRNVLLSQIHRDLQTVGSSYPAAEFVADLLAGGDAREAAELQGEAEDLLGRPATAEDSPGAREFWRRWDAFCHRLFHAYQDLAEGEVEAGGVPDDGRGG